jgi:formylglycine-generating enzyme required for sulfatase activity/uncharacterized caspase-like protein
MRWQGNLTLGLLLCCVIQANAWAEKRVALVIGNGAYANAPNLPNPSHDADDVAAALSRMDFDVIRGADLDHSGMQEAVIRFARAAQSAGIGIFYYSGHAMQFNGVNYLMPVDAKLDDEADLYRFTKVDDVLGYLQQVKALKVLVLDSCRDNPLAETMKRLIGATRAASIQRGLARIEAPTGMIISYSTQAGRTALDGKGRNSPYTAAFLKHIEEPREIGEIFRYIGADVYHATGETQLPELSLSIIGQLYLKGPVSLTANLPSPSPPADPCAAAADHWKSAESIGSLVALEDHLARFSTCSFAGLAKARISALKTKVAVVVPPLPQAKPFRAQEVAPAAVMKPSQTPGDVFKECDLCPDMVVIPAGSFHMGHKEVGHEVTIAKPFAIGRFHVTVDQFATFATETGYEANSCGGEDDDHHSWRDPGFSQSGSHPVVCVSWHDAKAFVAWLSKKTGEAYRLPTEAEFEYAARAGTTTTWIWGNRFMGGRADNNSKDYALCSDCADARSVGLRPEGAVPVGSFKPNMFGLYDMAGNANQWVQDCEHEGGYSVGTGDGSAWTTGDCFYRDTRGGSWKSSAFDARAYDHQYDKPDVRNQYNGFRVARTLSP